MRRSRGISVRGGQCDPELEQEFPKILTESAVVYFPRRTSGNADNVKAALGELIPKVSKRIPEASFGEVPFHGPADAAAGDDTGAGSLARHLENEADQMIAPPRAATVIDGSVFGSSGETVGSGQHRWGDPALSGPRKRQTTACRGSAIIPTPRVGIGLDRRTGGLRVGCGETSTAPSPAAAQDPAAVLGLHPGAKSVLFDPAPVVRLKRALHDKILHKKRAPGVSQTFEPQSSGVRRRGQGTHRTLAPGGGLWDAFFVRRRTRFLGRRAPIAAGSLGSAILLSLCAATGWTQGSEPDPERAAVREEGGFREPVRVIPEIGLWADGLTELGYAERPGLLLWWGLEEPAEGAASRLSEIDWSRIAFRVRIEIFNENGSVVAREQKIIEPFRDDEFRASGGFPYPMHILMAQPGTYRTTLEAYPLIDAESAGLDSVPRGFVELEAIVAERLDTSPEWQVSDLLFLDSHDKWTAGGSAERTWYEWFILPNVARSFAPDSLGAFVAFEIQRGEELVPRCRQNNCRVLISVYDGDGGLHLQTLRSVPDPNKVSAYVVPIETIDLESGPYRAEVHIFEGSERILGVSRGFEIRSISG